MTVYAPRDAHVQAGDLTNATNFATCITLAKALDARLLEAGFKTEQTIVAKTDALVGRSGRVSVRFSRYGKRGSSALQHPKGWEDSHVRRFKENFPDLDTYNRL